ncbi:MAG: hypothetical protein QOH70_2127 [Blastocatellia bacterium]|jgi:hypothetical protein|nr:hypothetical protein [Blastocatellia bacterium]
MKRLLTSLLLTICFCSIGVSQEAQDAKNKKLLADAAKNGNRLLTEITVNGNVHVQAVLIPKVDAKRIFGKDIGENYAVIEVNVGNKSPDAALIIHGIFLDYRDWPLSGLPPSELRPTGSTDKFQASSVPSQVASEEYRVVRGQLLDAQMDTVRNRFLRWLTLAGNLAGAFTFSLNEQGIIRGIAAATGVGIPGVATAWPDRTVDQLNRVSDFGFRSPKLISKQGSEVIVCFFPIDRFLTPGFRKLFLKSPALFFAPLQMLIDKESQKDVQNALDEIGGGYTFKQLSAKLPCYMVIRHQPSSPGFAPCLDEFGLEIKDAKINQLRVKVDSRGKPDATELEKFKAFMALEFIGSVSLNRVAVTIDGVMAVEINDVAARIDEVELIAESCGDQKTQCFWTDLTASGGVRKGIIHGAYLKDAAVNLAEASALKIEDVKTLKEESTDEELHFSFKLTERPKSQTKLHFTVIKEEKRSDNVTPKKLESNTWEYVIDYPTSGPGIAGATLSTDKKELTVTGQNFQPNLKVTVRSEDGEELDVPSITDVMPDKFKIVDVTQIPNIHPGCWDVHVKVNNVSSNNSSRFEIEPKPTIESAIRDGKVIKVTGKELFDSTSCGGKDILFKFVEKGSTTANPLKPQGSKKGKSVDLELPSDLQKDGLTGTVQIIRSGKVISEKELTSP